VNKLVVVTSLAMLVAALADAQTTQLLGIVQTGTPEDVQAALDNGSDVNGRTSAGVTPLMLAANANPNSQVIVILVKAGADIDAREPGIGATALLYAAAYNPRPEVTAELLKLGADINVRDTKNGRTALIWAANANPEPEGVILVLLEAGVDPRAEDKLGYTAYDYAQFNQKLKGTKALIQLEKLSK
jgi:uncharacterized protein